MKTSRPKNFLGHLCSPKVIWNQLLLTNIQKFADRINVVMARKLLVSKAVLIFGNLCLLGWIFRTFTLLIPARVKNVALSWSAIFQDITPHEKQYSLTSPLNRVPQTHFPTKLNANGNSDSFSPREVLLEKINLLLIFFGKFCFVGNTIWAIVFGEKTHFTTLHLFFGNANISIAWHTSFSPRKLHQPAQAACKTSFIKCR